MSAAFVALSSFAAAPKGGITFQVEELSKPENLLPVTSYQKICELLRESDLKLQNPSEDTLSIVAKSDIADSLVYFGARPFFNGIYKAYAEHRPYVLSPDMIWLLICQGFAQHVAANKEALRDYFVDFEGSTSLVIVSDDIPLTAPAERWEAIFPQFTAQLAQNTKNNIIQTLSADFSTTTNVERMASQITIMKAMENYFEYIVVYVGCGIPEITLLGTTEDWKLILDKTKQLARYDLGWWVDEMVPILEQFVKTSKGKVNKKFWMNMFKYHDSKKAYEPGKSDGWILKFFPYDKNGNRNNMVELEGTGNLPNETVKVDLKYIEITLDGKQEETMLELLAGFVGAEQDEATFALTPRIGWMISRKEAGSEAQQNELEEKGYSGFRTRMRLNKIPDALLEVPFFRRLEIEFIDEINIPDEMGKMDIRSLTLTGKTTPAEIERIKKMFPETNLKINNIEINKGLDLDREPDPDSDPRFRATADSILAATLPAGYEKLVKFRQALGNLTFYTGLRDGEKTVNLFYDFYHKSGAKLLNRKQYLKPSYLITLDMEYRPTDPIDTQMLERTYAACNRNIISQQEALTIVGKQIETNELIRISLIYDLDEDLMIWYASAWEGEGKSRKIKEVTINAQTGEVVEAS